MTQDELLVRSQAWLSLPYPENREPANRQELNTLYQAITGTAADCANCVNWLLRMAAKVTEYVANPSSFTIKPTQTEIMSNVSKKYRKSAVAKANDATQVVINHGNGDSQLINLDTMTDEEAEVLLSKDQYKHNVEVIGSQEEEAPKLTEKQQLQARYKELTGEDAEEKTTIAELKVRISEEEAKG